jgi:hypothetical protein
MEAVAVVAQAQRRPRATTIVTVRTLVLAIF